MSLKELYCNRIMAQQDIFNAAIKGNCSRTLWFDFKKTVAFVREQHDRSDTINFSTAKLFNLNFHPLEVVSR